MNKNKLKVKTKPIRKKNEREALKGYTCRSCKAFYEALGLSQKQMNDMIQLCSRHRFVCTPPRTPDKFWDLNFPKNNKNNKNNNK